MNMETRTDTTTRVCSNFDLFLKIKIVQAFLDRNWNCKSKTVNTFIILSLCDVDFVFLHQKLTKSPFLHVYR